MASHSHHRKLLNESEVDPTVAKICKKYCDAEENLDEGCPFTCIDLCPSVCKIPLFEIPPPPPSAVVIFSAPLEKSHRPALLLTISLAVLAAAFLFFICYTIYKFYSNLYSSRRSRLSQRLEDGGPDDLVHEDHGPVVDHPIWYIRTIGLQPSVIGAITIFKYKKGDGLIDGTDCSVCLSEFEEGETLRLLPKCNHAFHVRCIDTWLGSHTNCPMCRAGIVNYSAGLPSSHEQIVPNSGLGPVEEARLGISGRTNRESWRELETEPSELRIGIENDTVSRALNGLKYNESLVNDPGGLGGIQPLRRSISADSLSALFPGKPDRNSDNQFVEESTFGVVANRCGLNQSLLRLIGSPLVEKSNQTGSSSSCSSIKRSLSCSADVLPSRHSNKNRN